MFVGQRGAQGLAGDDVKQMIGLRGPKGEPGDIGDAVSLRLAIEAARCTSFVGRGWANR